MRHPEDEISHLPGRQAPLSLDHRVAQTLGEYKAARRLRVPVWACVTACLLCFLAGWVLKPSLPAEPEPTEAFLEVPMDVSPSLTAFFSRQARPESFFLQKKHPLNPYTP